MRKNASINQSVKILRDKQEAIIQALLTGALHGNQTLLKEALDMLFKAETDAIKSAADAAHAVERNKQEKIVFSINVELKKAQVKLFEQQRETYAARSEAERAMAQKSRVETKLMQLRTIRPNDVIEAFGSLMDSFGVIVMSINMDEDEKQALLDDLVNTTKKIAVDLSMKTTEGSPSIRLEGIDDFMEEAQRVPDDGVSED